MKGYQVVAAMLRKDLRAESRGWESTLSMVLFAVTILLVFNFATSAANRMDRAQFDLQMHYLFEEAAKDDASLDSLAIQGTSLSRNLKSPELLAAVLWIAILLAAVLGLNRSSAAEQEEDCLLALLLAPVDRAHIYLGKAASNWVMLLLLNVVVLPVFGILYRANLLDILFPLLAVIGLGTLGLTLAGTLFSYIAAQTRAREVLLPLLMFPIVTPVLIGATLATAGLLSGQGEPVRLWCGVLGVFDVVLGVLSFLLFEAVVSD